MAPSSSKDLGKRPVSVDDDSDVDDLDGADSNNCTAGPLVIHRTMRTRLQMYSTTLRGIPPRNLHLNPLKQQR
jgi:hypothetical protein